MILNYGLYNYKFLTHNLYPASHHDDPRFLPLGRSTTTWLLPRPGWARTGQ